MSGMMLLVLCACTVTVTGATPGSLTASEQLLDNVGAEALDVDDECQAAGRQKATCMLNALQLSRLKLITPSDDKPTNDTASEGPRADSLPFGHPSASIDYPTYLGFTLYLAEEFDAPLDLDKDPIWTWSDGGLSEGQVRFVKEAITFSGGKMHITASNTLHPPTQACSHAESGFIGNNPPKRLTSGEIRTRYNMFRYGRYEVRMKAPSVQPGNTQINGNYISTMFVYRDAKFHHWREIDIEQTGDSPSSLTTNVLFADHTSQWSRSITATKAFHPTGMNLRSDFHTYAFEWLPDSITWYVDEQVYRRYTGGRIPVPEMSGKIMMNLWIFGPSAGFGGPEIQNNRYPMENEYEYFRFYKWDGDKKYPCSGLTPSCLTSEDRYLTGNNPCDGIPQEGTIHGKPPCIASCYSAGRPA